MRRIVPFAAAALLAVVAVPTPARVLGATPEPVDPFPTIETWIDASPDDPAFSAPDARNVLIGATFWNARDHELFAINGLVVKLYPAKGKAKPTRATAVSDVPGHITAQLQIPDGGPGRVEIVTTGQECGADGTCHDAEIPLRIAGVGPPPDAPRGTLVRAELLPITGDVVAGRPASVAVNVQPIGLWDARALALPDRLQVVVLRVGGARLGSAQLQQDPAGAYQPYQGSIRVPEPGEMSLTAAFVGANGSTDPIAGELGRLQVIGSPTGAGASPRPSATPGAGDAPAPGTTAEDAGPPWLVIGAVVVLVIGLALFLGEPLTRRLRGGRGDDDRR